MVLVDDLIYQHVRPLTIPLIQILEDVQRPDAPSKLGSAFDKFVRVPEVDEVLLPLTIRVVTEYLFTPSKKNDLCVNALKLF